MTPIQVDLHTHTQASDGEISPLELLTKAYKLSIKVLSITDHDTVDGLTQAMEVLPKFPGLILIPGIELACIDKGYSPPLSLHLLAYFIDYTHPKLTATLLNRKEQRHKRNMGIINQLKALDITINLETLSPNGRLDSISRLNIALALVGQKVVASVEAAFSLYLAIGKPAYFPREDLPLNEAISLIREIGGISIVAHPGLLPINLNDLTKAIKRWHELGIDGVELCHPNNSCATQAVLWQAINRYGLLYTGGSDFHGTTFKPKHILGQLGCCVDSLEKPISKILLERVNAL